MNSEDALTFPTFRPIHSLACKCGSSRLAPSCVHVLLFILVYKILGRTRRGIFYKRITQIRNRRYKRRGQAVYRHLWNFSAMWRLACDGQHCDVPEKPGKGTLFSFFIITVMNNFGQFSTYLVNSRRGVSFWSLTGNPVTNGIDGKFPYWFPSLVGSITRDSQQSGWLPFC